MKILVCGGRDFADLPYLTEIMNKVDAAYCVELVIHGDAEGADRLSGQWADSKEVPVSKYPADWAAIGRAAGPIRNQLMLDEGKPHAVVAFPGGRGTQDMCDRAQKAGVQVWPVPIKNPGLTQK